MTRSIESNTQDFTQIAGPIIISGGAYSGKSAFAAQCFDPKGEVLVLGTYKGKDPELLASIEALQCHRPAQWLTKETSEDLDTVLTYACQHNKSILIDSMNQWLAEFLVEHAARYSIDQLDQIVLQKTQSLIQAISNSPSRIVVVTSDMGSGLAPSDELGRIFRKRGAQLNLQLTRISQSAVMMNMGIPLLIK
jgi:adenosyl cobinamide kinase/adenosyl cobinamide phosphate guanylyltransferase